MNVLAVLIPVSVILGLAGLCAFVWTLRSGQYDDPAGDPARILDARWDDAPRTAPARGARPPIRSRSPRRSPR